MTSDQDRMQGTSDGVRGMHPTTEEELLGDQTELLRQQQVYLSTLARLRFEAGQLVSFSGLGDASEALRFIPTEFVIR